MRVWARNGANGKVTAQRAVIRQACFEALEDRVLFAAPTLDQPAAVTVPIGGSISKPLAKTLIVPLSGHDADGNPLKYTVTSDKPGIVSVDLHTGNPFVKLTVAPFTYLDSSTSPATPVDSPGGDIVIQMLHDVAPNTVNNIDGLIQAGFYNHGMTFHRVVKDFVIQGGDPNGDGSGGPGFKYDDEFNASAIFTGDGQLAMANSGDDSNGSQFFITVGPQRVLDFNYTLFGQVVQGLDLVKQINNVATIARDPSNPTVQDEPATPVTFSNVQLFQDTTDAVVTLTALSRGTAHITVKVSDGHGGTDTKTFVATAAADKDATTHKAFFDPAFLGPVPNLVTPVNTPITIPLTGTDIGGRPLSFAAAVLDSSGATVAQQGANITVTPATGYTGVIQVIVGVQRKSALDDPNNSLGQFDTQRITIVVGDAPIMAHGSAVAAVAGIAHTQEVATFTDADPAAAVAEYIAKINWGDDNITDGTITKAGGRFVVTGTNTYSNVGTYPVSVTIEAVTHGTDSTTGQPTTTQSGAIETATSTAQVASGLVAYAGGATIARKGLAFSRTGSVAGPAGVALSATVDYGDGSGTHPLPLDANGVFKLNHVYAADGSFKVVVKLSAGASGAVTSNTAVTVLAPPVAVVGGDRSGVRGQSRTITLGAHDPGSGQAAGSYAYTIDWGDGSPLQTVAIGTRSATHLYTLAGAFKVMVRAIDQFGVAGPTTISPMDMLAAQVQTDFFNSSLTGLVVGGTPGADNIHLVATTTGMVAVFFGNTLVGQYKPTGLLYVFGYGGNDSITVDQHIGYPTELYGGDGNDTLTGGGGINILVGGAGNDVLTGGPQRDILVGGTGKDKLTGGAADDILVAGSVVFENNPAQMTALAAEWTQNTTAETYAVRVGHIEGPTGGQNGSIFLDATTVKNDDNVDNLVGGDGMDLYLMDTSATTKDTSDATASETRTNITA